MKAQLSVLAVGTASLVLAACGGGGGGGGMSGASGMGSSPPPATNTAPTVSNLNPDQTMLQDSISAPIMFGVSDKETSAGALKIGVQSSNAELIDSTGIDIGGDGADRTLVLRPKPGMAGDATLTVSATDAGGMATSQTLTVHVSTQQTDYTQFVSTSIASPETADPAETLGKTWTNVPTDDPNAFNSLLTGQ